MVVAAFAAPLGVAVFLIPVGVSGVMAVMFNDVATKGDLVMIWVAAVAFYLACALAWSGIKGRGIVGLAALVVLAMSVLLWAFGFKRMKARELED